MAYTKSKRAAAARKGWERRKKQLPDYSQGVEQQLRSTQPGDTVDLAGELPTSRLFEAGNIASWPDPVYDIDPDGYRVIHNCLPVIKSIEKRGVRIAKLNWSAIGQPDRAEAFATILKQAKSFVDMVKWLSWADIDGVRFCQIKQAMVGQWLVPDFFMGGRKKYKAGGDIQWDGRKLVRVKRNTGAADVDYAKLPAWQFLIHRPGAGSNPEGDSNVGIATYRGAYSWEEAHKNIDAHMELFGVPIRVFKGKLDSIRPDQVVPVLQSRAERLKLMKANKQAVLDDEEMIDLLEPKGQGFKDMLEYCRYLEGLFDQLFLANQLTSSVQDAKRTGDTSIHLSEESESIYCGAMQIAETLNRCLIPWIVRKNGDLLPPLKDGEPEVCFWPEPPVKEDSEEDDQDITVDGDMTPGETKPDGDEDDDDAGTADREDEVSE